MTMCDWGTENLGSRPEESETPTPGSVNFVTESNVRERRDALRARATIAELRAGVANRSLRKVAELAAQHLADTRPRDGRPAILGPLAGAPAVAHLAELVLTITGPPTAATAGNLLWPVPGEEDVWPLLLRTAGHRSPEVGELLTRHCTTLGVTPPGFHPRRTLTVVFDGDPAAVRFFELNGHRLLGELLAALTGHRWDVAFSSGPGLPASPVTPEPDPSAAGEAAIEERVRHTIAARIRGQRIQPSCWTCGTDGVLRAAESIALGRWNLPAGKESPGEVPEYGTPEYQWWLAGIRRAHQLTTDGLGDQALELLETAENLVRRRPDATAADLVAELVLAITGPPPARAGEDRAEVLRPWTFFAEPWRMVLQELQARNMPLRDLLAQHCVSYSVMDDRLMGLDRGERALILRFDCEDTRDRFVEMKGWEVLEAMLTDVVGGRWRTASSAPSAPTPAEQADRTEEIQKRIDAALNPLLFGEHGPTLSEAAEHTVITPERIRAAMAKLKAAPPWPPRIDTVSPAEWKRITGEPIGTWEPKETPPPPRPATPVRETKENPAPDPEPDDAQEAGEEPAGPGDHAADLWPCATVALRPVIGIDAGPRSMVTAPATQRRGGIVFNVAGARLPQDWYGTIRRRFAYRAR